MADATQPRALALVTEEHRAILSLLDQLGGADGDRRRDIIDEALLRLDVHQQLKRELLYPALEAADADAVEELIDGNEELEDLLDELDEADEDEDAEVEEDQGSDDNYAGLADQLRAHFEDEEQTLGELIENAEGVDLEEVGKAMETRREELRRELGETGVLASDSAT